MTHISKRYAEANNKYMKDYDKTKPAIYIQYLDANSLYAYAMSQKLPSHGFKWIDVDIPKVEKLLKKKDTKIGYIFEVDLEYPQSLWEEHNNLILLLQTELNWVKWKNLFLLSFRKKNMLYITKV